VKSEMAYAFALALFLAISAASRCQEQQRPPRPRLALDKLELHHVKAEPVTYLGRSAVRLTDASPQGLHSASSTQHD
jgi:hypothetical protein